MSEFHIAFYVHHHGSGHLMRTLQIVAALEAYPVILMGSGLDNLVDVPSNVTLVHLPPDVPTSDEDLLPESIPPMGFHYAPLGVKGSRDRVALMTEVFRQYYPLILVVDVSIEVALLARLAGIPSVIIKQHGKRDDLPHQLAYDSAEIIIAPYSESMSVDYPGNFDSKTVYTGGFSKFDQHLNRAKIQQNLVCVLVGKGGTSINHELLVKIASNCSEYQFHVLGLANFKHNLSNLFCHGHVQDASELMAKAWLVIGNTGHNTVMETASLNKHLIGIPELRPFDEQVEKAMVINDRRGVKIIQPKELQDTNWSNLLAELAIHPVDWQGVINPMAVKIIAETIIKTAKKSIRLL
ncbi:glycosyltransferase [Pedobacter sandarakinus]|uniref:glycosyltransferase n=1 Tax=Pedobacter sandarakinus TaxID=353156 RepID=UPI002246852B|nr:glycosyltransferase [Pedobacter sandarakinus]MCX2574140.1 glycosyltransferase [Pedobacter sandarakinus]